ncbi:MAG: XdhC family protein [Pseudomonadota bacterium]
MTHLGPIDFDLAEAVSGLRERDEPFAFATIVRTAGATAAKPGAKAVVAADGQILKGWLGGGCTQAAVRETVRAALEDGQPRLISVAPDADLSRKGAAPGDEVDGVRFARNGCPSQGSIDIFIEPCLPAPELVVYGSSPVAEALVQLAGGFHWRLTRAGAAEALPPAVSIPGPVRAVVVATQGQGDLKALEKALGAGAGYVAFVGSRRKFAALAGKLKASGMPAEALDAVKAPAGLDIGAVTPEEIALSIMAALTAYRRRQEPSDRGA